MNITDPLKLAFIVVPTLVWIGGITWLVLTSIRANRWEFYGIETLLGAILSLGTYLHVRTILAQAWPTPLFLAISAFVLVSQTFIHFIWKRIRGEIEVADFGKENEKDSGSVLSNSEALRKIQQILIIVVCFLLVAHSFQISSIRVDAVSLGLLGLLLAIPFAEFIKKIKIGDFEAEIGRDEIEKIRAKASVDLPEPPEGGPSKPNVEIQSLLLEDPRLAMAKIRIEIESSLKRLHETVEGTSETSRRLSLGKMVENLRKKDVINSSIAGGLRDVISLANRAVHGERIEPDAVKDLAKLGIRLIEEVDLIYFKRQWKALESEPVTSQEVRAMMNEAKFRVTTIVPLVENPVRNTYIFDQDRLNDFLEYYHEYAEFIVKIEKVEG